MGFLLGTSKYWEFLLSGIYALSPWLHLYDAVRISNSGVLLWYILPHERQKCPAQKGFKNLVAFRGRETISDQTCHQGC